MGTPEAVSVPAVLVVDDEPLVLGLSWSARWSRAAIRWSGHTAMDFFPVRRARLLPAFTPLYPEIVPNVWMSALKATQLVQQANLRHERPLWLIADVDTALKGLSDQGKLATELQETGRRMKERAARWRSEKRLADADVAQAGGSEKRATRLRAEAAVLWAQDYAKAILTPPCPRWLLRGL
jgi:hypothetical protein